MFRLILCSSTLLFLVACNQNSTNQQPNHSETNNEVPDAHASGNQALIDSYYEHFNNHDWGKMADLYVDSPTMRDPAYGLQPVVMSKTDIIKKYSELHQMIPDVQDRVTAVYHAGIHSTVEFESSGTGPDGKKFILPICTIFEIKNGKITKDLTYYDNTQE